jgi:glycosyltransferase involved in cell wall biosynthesis
MNLLFLRGKADRQKEIAYSSIGTCLDTWEQLAYAMTGPQDVTKVLYWGGNRKVYYSDNFSVLWLHDFRYYYGMTPDTIIARGGFKEYATLMKQYPKALKVWYGANHGCIPNDGIKYDMVLCDSPSQVETCKKAGLNGQLFIKPAPPSFGPVDVPKKYDCLFSAIWPSDKRKNVGWVYKTAPKELKILQVGNSAKGKIPGNITIKYVKKSKMAKAISKCKVVIAPYKSDDSCPRIIPEALACGVPVVALKDVNIWRDKYEIATVPKADFWPWVKTFVRNYKELSPDILKYYKENLSLEVAGKHLKALIEEARRG